MRIRAESSAHRRTSVVGLLSMLVTLGGACSPKDFATSSNDEEGEPFGGGARGGTGSTPQGGSSGTGPGCGDITPVGVCMGDFISYCDDGTLVEGDCKSLDPSCRCAFNAEKGINDCICGGGSGGSGGAAGMGATGGR